MVWIHGGAFVNGSGSQEMYDGSALARRGVVLVTINYRLAALGFSFLRDLAPEHEELSANPAIEDQLAALRWVQENIARFGGDPGNVTLFGESAGGMSVATLMGTPSAHGLFHRAIPQSGAAHHTVSREDATRVTRALLDALRIPPGAARKLQETPLEDLLRAQQVCFKQVLNPEGKDRRLPMLGMPFLPVRDGQLLPQDPLDAIRGGSAAQVPLLIGTNLDEWMLFVRLVETGKQNLSAEGLHKVCKRRIPRGREALIETYLGTRGGENAETPTQIYAAIESDRMFRIPAIRLAEAQASVQPAVYNYLFTWPSPMMRGAIGAGHAVEIPFVFGTLGTPFGRLFSGDSPEAWKFSERVMDIWTSFARDGQPAAPAGLDWPRYEPERRATLTLGEQHSVLQDPASEERRAWDELL